MNRPEPKVERRRRTDAARNRVALLRAAERLFAERGFDVPLAEIAAAAGVGRTTLLRNFATRMDLAFALFEQAMVEIRALAAGQSGAPGDFEALLDLKLEFYIRNGGLAEAVQKQRGLNDNFVAERDEIARLLLAAAAPLIAHGRFRDDLTVQSFVIIQQAISGAMLAAGSEAERRDRAAQLKSLLLDGLRSRRGEEQRP